MQTERWPASTGARRPVDTAVGAEFDVLKSRLEHCRDLIERVLQLMSADAPAVERDPQMTFDHGPQGAD